MNRSIQACTILKMEKTFQEAFMDKNKGKVKLDVELLDHVAGGYGMQGAVCPCGETNINQFYIVSRGPETEILHCRTCGQNFTHYWE